MDQELTQLVDELRLYVQEHSNSVFVRMFAGTTKFDLQMPDINLYKDKSNEEIINDLIYRLALPPFQELPVKFRESILNFIRLIRQKLNN